jgi:enoyl-CoA hydratase/carnithine racemase
MAEPVHYSLEQGVAVLTIDVPDQRNAISDRPVVDALVDTLKRADADPAVRVAILTGAGSIFSSGGNVKAMGKGGGGSLADPLPARTRRNYRDGIQRIPLAIEALEIPVIAAVNGAAIGAGCDLACMCDLRIASDKAWFAESFVKVGLVPGDGGAWLLPRIVGFSKATEMALTGDPVHAEEALRFGLVSRVVPGEELMAAAHELAARIAVNPPFAVRMTRRLLREAWRSDLDKILELSSGLQALAHATRDHEEAVAAFIEKRTPTFTGE